MRRQPPKKLFALDQNFPQPIVDALAPMLPCAELVPIREIDAAFPTLNDWELFRDLHCHNRPWDGLVTNDDKLLALPKEMAVLSQTGLTLIIAVGQGDNPIRATGALLCHLEHICSQSAPRTPQVWTLAVRQKAHETPQHFLDRIAKKTGTEAADLFKQNRLPELDVQRRARRPT